MLISATMQRWVAAAVLGLLAACAAAPPADVPVQGKLSAAAGINPDREGRPSPLVVRIYQLKAREKFEAADFFPLYEQAESALGTDLLAFEDVLLTPGETKPYQVSADPQTRFIGVLAAYRDIHQAEWKAIVPVPEPSGRKLGGRGELNVRADALSVSVAID